MRIRPSALCLGSLLLICAGERAGAETYSYRGEIRIQTAPGDPCAATSADGAYAFTMAGIDDSPAQRIDGYLEGDKLVAAHVTGNDPGQLSVTYPGEPAPSHRMHLRALGNGAFEGNFEARTIVAALAGCGYSTATIKFARTALHAPEGFVRAKRLFGIDSAAVEAYAQGIRGQVKEALDVIGQGMRANESEFGSSSPRLLPYLYFLSRMHDAAGSFAQETPLLRRAVAICEQSDGAHSVCTGLMLASLGEAQAKIADYAGAEASLRHAQTICEQAAGKDAPFSGALLDSLGMVLMYTGRYGEAEQTLNHALAVNRASFGADSARVGLTLINQGVLYRFTGQYARAEASLRRALTINEKALGADDPLVILNTVDLAAVLRMLGRYAEAEPIARRGLAAARKVLGPERPDHPALGVALVNLAELLRETGRYQEAEPLYRQALANDEKFLGPDHPDVAGVDALLARLLHSTDRDREALALLKRAYRISHTSDNPLIGWRVPAELMELYASGTPAQPAVAIFYGKEAVNTLETLRGNLRSSGSDVQQAFVGAEEVKSVYRTLANLLISEKRLSEAQQVLAMLKEQEFFDYTQRAAAVDAPKTVAAFSAAEKQLDDLNGRQVLLGREYGALQQKFRKDQRLIPADRERLNALRKQMDAAQADFEVHAAAVAGSSADAEARRVRGQEINDFSRAFQGTLKDMDHDSVLAQYFILDDHVEILLTTPTAVLARQMTIRRRDLNDKIAAYRKTLSSPNRDPLPQAMELYRLLLGPIAADLHQAGARTLMLSLDDTLRYLPFAALHDGNRYLVDSMSVVIVTEAVRDKLAKAPLANWSVWGLGVTHGGEGYAPLPYVAAELNGIAGRNGILSGKVLLDKAFDESSLRDGLDQGYPIVHIASHFQFTPGSMNDSFLLLGDGSRLTLEQIKTKLNFNGVELLTLSACETALGDDGVMHHGVEVEGLGAIAQQAGAKAVLATLWPVADGSTAALMRAMYQAHKNGHADKADALRSAQRSLLHGATLSGDGAAESERGLARVNADPVAAVFKADPRAPFAHPYYWAPFILMGNWQ